MSEKLKRTMDETGKGYKITIAIEHAVSVPVTVIVEKARQFLRWAAAPGQGKLDLSTSIQVTLSHVNLSMDKPKKSSEKFDVGIHAEKLSIKDQSTLFNLHQTGAKFEVLFREIPKAPPKASNVKSKGAPKKSAA